MSYLVNRIIRALIDTQNTISPTAIYRRHKFVNKERDVEVVDGVTIRIKLNEHNYMKILTKLQYGEKKNFVEERNAIKWIEETMVGPVTKEILEKERFHELDGLDMMQNTGIIYNPQAIIET